MPYTNVIDNPVADTARLEAVEVDPAQHEVERGVFFFTVSCETPEEVGMSSAWLSGQRKVRLNSFCFGFRQNVSFGPFHLAYMLRCPGARAALRLLAQGISRSNISKKKVMELAVSVPQISEQRAIGTFFRDLNDLIALHQREHGKALLLLVPEIPKLLNRVFGACDYGSVGGDEIASAEFKQSNDFTGLGWSHSWDVSHLLVGDGVAGRGRAAPYAPRAAPTPRGGRARRAWLGRLRPRLSGRAT